MLESTHHGAPLSAQAAQRVSELESEMGDVYLIAYDRPVVPAQLTPTQVAELQRAEQELGVYLVAYQKTTEDQRPAARVA